jgi:probable HAF family extracellular repeat protein
MKANRNSWTFWTAALVTIVLICINATVAQTRYRVEDLGTLGGTFGTASGLNNRDWVTGLATLPGDSEVQAFLWRKGVMADLGTLGGPNSWAATANERGQIVGGAETPMQDPNQENDCFFGTTFQCLPFSWRHGKMTALPTLGGTNGFANSINNRGQVIGYAENSVPDSTCAPGTQVLEVEPVLWDQGEIQQLPTIVGDNDGVALVINDKGQTVGATGSCFSAQVQHHAVFWPDRGTVIDLGNLGGAQNNIAEGINNRGQIVGHSGRSDGTTHAFLWQDGTMSDLGTLAGDSSSFAWFINDKSQMVGTSVDANGNSRAFLRRDDTLIDLNTLIPGNSPLSLLDAFAINEQGDIVGDALQKATGQVHAYLAKRCEESDSDDGCCDRDAVTAVSAQSNENERFVTPENIRRLVQERLVRRSLSRPFGKQ